MSEQPRLKGEKHTLNAKDPRPKAKPTTKKAEISHFAFFQDVFNGPNEVVLRRWSIFDVQFTCRESCDGCLALHTSMLKFPCIRKIHKISAKSGVQCHRLVEFISFGRDAYVLGSLKLPKTVLPKVFHREISAALKVKKPFRPLAHQRALVEQCFGRKRHPELPKGVLIGFALGSGKTHSSLYLAHDRGFRIITIVCAVSLIGQWQASIRHHPPPSIGAEVVEYRVFGYNRFDAVVFKDPNAVSLQCVIVDEAHHFKNMTAVMEPAIQALERSACTILLTGTAVRNDVRDMDFILRICGHSDLIPEFLDGEAGRGDGAWVSGNNPPPNPYSDVNLLKRIMHVMTGQVAMYSPKFCEKRQKFLEHYPQTKERTVFHTLTWPQCLERFLFADGVMVKFRPNGRKINMGASGGVLRRLSVFNAVKDEENGRLYSSKADSLIKEIEDLGRFPVVVYSRFKANLLEPLTERVARHFGKRVALLTGDTPQQDRQPLLNAYNSREVDVLLICSFGSEGLDLTAPTAALFILEPQTNIAAEDQVAGRVVRFSKEKRTPEQQATPIQIVKFVCQFPGSGETPTKQDEKEFLLDVVNGHPGVVEGLTGHRPRGGEFGDVSLDTIVEFLQRRMSELKKTDEEVMHDTNLQKQARIYPLTVLLWNASEICGTVPSIFADSWLKITGESAKRNANPFEIAKSKQVPIKRPKQN